MANLLSWLGGAAKRVGNTVNNDILQPINRDIVQPIQRNPGQILNNFAPGLREANTPGTLSNKLYGPAIQGIQGTAAGAYHIGAIVPNELRTLAALATGNRPAAESGFRQAGQGLQDARSFAQFLPKAAIQTAATIGAPFTPHPTDTSFYSENPIVTNLTGGGEIPSLQRLYKTTKQQGGTASAIGTTATTGLTDLLGVLGAAKTLEHPALKAANTLETGYKSNPNLASQAGNTRIPGKANEQLASQKALEYAKDPNSFDAKGNFKAPIQKELDAIMNGRPPSVTPTASGATTKNYRPRIPTEPTQGVNPAVAKLASKTTVLEKIGTPSSQLAAEKIRGIDTLTQDLRAGYRNSTRTALSLSKDEFNNLGDVIEHGAEPINTKVAQAVAEAKATLPKVLEDYTGTGAKTGNIKNYFPRDYSGLKKGSAPYNQALQSLLDSGQAKSTGEAVSILNGLSGKGKVAPGFFGAFDKARYDVPGYRYSKAAYERYLNGAAQKTAESTHFGPKGEVAKDLVGKIAREGGDAQLANKAISNYLKAPGGTDYLAPARGAFGAARLGKAPISHLGQSTNIPLVTRLQDLPVAIGKSLTKEGRDYITESDVNNPANIHGLAQQETSVKGVLNKVTAAGLSPVMKVNRGLASLAGREYGQHLASVGNETELRGLGVTGDIGKTLTHEQELQASRGVANKTMFNPTRASTPVSAETPLGKTIGQYRTAYSYKQTGLVWNNVIKEAGSGNLKPLAKFLAVSAPVAAGTIAAKNAISGTNTFQKEGPGGKALDLAGALGGIPGELALQALRYGPKNILKTAAGAVAPIAGEAVDIGQRAQEALQGKPNQLERYGLGLAPIIGGRLASALAPTVTQQKETTTDTGIKQINGKFYVKATDQTFKTQKAAQDAVNKDTFDKSGKNYQDINGTIYRRDAQGNITSTSKTKFEYQVGTATLVKQKNAGDLNGWISTASKQLDSISKQLRDPSIDPLEALTLQNDAESLQSNIEKYKGYGGFTKPKAGKKLSAASFKTASVKAPTISGVKVKKLAAPALRATKKYAVSKIPSSYTKRKLA